MYNECKTDVCRKDYYTAASYGGFLGTSPIPISPLVYNVTSSGAFCVTSLLTQYTAYIGANLTLPYVTAAITGANSTAVMLGESVNLNILCNPCIFAWFDLVELVYSVVGSVQIGGVFQLLGLPVPTGLGNVTINQAVDGECAYKPLSIVASELRIVSLPLFPYMPICPLAIFDGASCSFPFSDLFRASLIAPTFPTPSHPWLLARFLLRTTSLSPSFNSRPGLLSAPAMPCACSSAVWVPPSPHSI